MIHVNYTQCGKGRIGTTNSSANQIVLPEPYSRTHIKWSYTKVLQCKIKARRAGPWDASLSHVACGIIMFVAALGENNTMFRTNGTIIFPTFCDHVIIYSLFGILCELTAIVFINTLTFFWVIHSAFRLLYIKAWVFPDPICRSTFQLRLRSIARKVIAYKLSSKSAQIFKSNDFIQTVTFLE